MRFPLKAWQVTSYYASFALFAAMAFALNCFCLACGCLPGVAARPLFFQRLVHRGFFIFVGWVRFAGIIRVRYRGFANGSGRSGRVVVANHPGLMDVGWLLARMPEAICVYKPDLGSNPLFGATARRAAYLPSDRGYHLLRTSAEKIAAGHTLLVFPEGTRSVNGCLNPLKRGFVGVARVARAPIQLVRITCDSELLTKKRPWWLLPRLPATVTVTLGPCLPPPGDDTAAVISRIESWFRHPADADQPASAHART